MREHLVNLALKLVGCPYIWGGANPWTGFDCSGFIIWIFQVFGLLPSGDWTAQGLAEHYRGGLPAGDALPQAGDLVFYGKSMSGVTHVMMSIGGKLVVGASGGGHLTTTREEAAKKGALVKVKPINYRGDMVGYGCPAFPGE
jgi:cell wall-associated NlpC family hydrolase